MSANALTVAVSPCPNDTFIFGAWILGLIPDSLHRPVRFSWADVEELNQSAASGRYDVVKMSAATAIRLQDDYEILPSGGAFGTGAGPKLAARPDSPQPPRTVAVPGLATTAFAVLQAALETPFEALPMRFDLVAEAVASGRADAGLLIHETALVPKRYGLEQRLDLGQWWQEHVPEAPLPLGVIGVRRSLDETLRQSIAHSIRQSLEQARANREAIWPLVRTLAKELDDATLEAHIQAYVDSFSLDMGPAGRRALENLDIFMKDSARLRAETAPNHLLSKPEHG